MLDALRGIGALVVVAMHGRELFWVGMRPFLDTHPRDFSLNALVSYALSPLISGAIGVSILFVLSGYVIHRPQIASLQGDGVAFAPSAFFQRRFLRIYPTLLLALLVTFVCDAISASYLAHPALGRTDAVTLGVNVASLQGIFAPPFGSNAPLWSLAIEVQFYAFYPLALMMRRRLGSGGMMAAAFALSAAGTVLFHQQGITAFPQYFAAWWLGAYMAERDAAGIALPRGWTWAAGLAILLGSVAYQRHYFLAGLTLWAIGVAPIISAAAGGRWPSLARSRFLKWIGQFSYTLYAVHFPVLVLLSTLVLHGVRQPNIFISIGLTCVGILVCYGAYFLAEEPSVRRLAAMRKSKSAAGGVLPLMGSGAELSPRTPAGTWFADWAARSRKVRRMQQLAKDCDGHPRYQLPHAGPAAELDGNMAAENYAYFLSQKSDRLADLRFLLAKSGVDTGSRGSVDAWVAAWADLLISHDQLEALAQCAPGWVSGNAALNIVHDLAIWTGEEVIAQSGHRWAWAQGLPADGCYLVLSDGTHRVDLVAMVGLCIAGPVSRSRGLADVRAGLLRSA